MSAPTVTRASLLAWARERAAADKSLLREWETWLRTLFPEHLTGPDGLSAPFAPYHREFWEWVWAIRRGRRPRPFVAIWPRGASKSTYAELACCAAAARGVRRFGLYVCETQAQADDHVANVGALFESSALAIRMPGVGDRLVSKVGVSKGWRRNRIRTKTFTLDAIGLDTAARGVKVENVRPDLIILDDIDRETDTDAAIERKITLLSKSILPTGRPDELAVIAVQNLIHQDGVFARLAGVSEHKIDMLTDRHVSGPHPAVEGLEYEEQDGRWVITAGTPTWEGQDLRAIQGAIDTEGITAVLTERQHQVGVRKGGLYDHVTWKRVDWAEMPDLVRVAVWVDPAVTNTDDSDSQAVQADGLGSDGRIYRLYSWERRASPVEAVTLAIRKALELGAASVGIETDQGGDTWESVYREAWDEAAMLWRAQHGGEAPPHRPRFRQEKAGQGHGPKAARQALVLADYERDLIRHVRGTHDILERALERFPKTKPHDLCDSGYYSWADLRGRLKSEPAPMGGVVLPIAASGGWNKRR